jgi:prepilin-type N-terminal cleavage/methylation domain-containing protein
MKQSLHHNKGLTLIELSIVVSLILSLISILFYGMASYKDQSDAARCKVKLAQLHKNIRAFGNFNEVTPGQNWNSKSIGGVAINFATDFTQPLTTIEPNALNCPTGVNYTAVNIVTCPKVGTLAYDCPVTVVTHSLANASNLTGNW